MASSRDGATMTASGAASSVADLEVTRASRRLTAMESTGRRKASVCMSQFGHVVEGWIHPNICTSAWAYFEGGQSTTRTVCIVRLLDGETMMASGAPSSAADLDATRASRRLTAMERTGRR
jgi:hypothetical protein